MIAYAITDGLGNQLFQYATARAISALYGSNKLYLDLSFYKGLSSHQRRYGLDQFKIRFDGYFDRENSTIVSKDRPHHPEKVVMSYFSSPRLWDPRVLTLRGDIHVQSFGQNWRHLTRIEAELRKELQFLHQPNEENRHYLSEIRTRPSVSVHVRRGDYLTLKYEVCALEYYQRAMSYMREKIPQVRFFIFSDSPEWGYEHFSKNRDVEFVTHNSPEECWEDLRLMSHCRGHIIANSTFSWWGAWLNPSSDTIVIAPSIRKKSDVPSQSLVLPGWIVI